MLLKSLRCTAILRAVQKTRNHVGKMAESHAESQDMFEMMWTIRGIKGVREDDEDALMAMYMEIANGPPGDNETDDSDVSEACSEDDDELAESDEIGLT